MVGKPALDTTAMQAGPTLDQLAADPHAHLAKLRARNPVSWVAAIGGWLVTDRASALTVLHDPLTFTVDDSRFSTARVVGRSMLSTDGDEHARHRQPFVVPFRRRRVEEQFAAPIDRRLAALVGKVEGDGAAELRVALAGPLAASVVADSLGLDGDDPDIVERLLAWYGDIVASVAGVAVGRPLTAQGADSMTALAAALAPVLAREGHSLLGDAVRLGGLSAAESVSDAAVVMFGGIETTEAMILNAVWFVLTAPGARDDLRVDRGLVAAAVEESLRLEPAAAVVDRYATCDVELAGAPIQAGDLVVVSLAGANRDPAEFPDPDRFDLRRVNLRRQLAFAAGPHVCLGMDLARLEAIRTLDMLLDRFPRLALAPGAPAPSGLVFRKPERLPVRW